MNRRIVLLISTATLTLARPVFAHRWCREVSDVVGYERCTAYGAGWSVERTYPIRVDFGLHYLALDPRGRTLKGSLGIGEPGSFRYSGDYVQGPLAALMFELRPSIFVISGLYVGYELGAGAGHADLPDFTTSDGWRVDASSAGVNLFAINFGGIAGYRIPVGSVSIRLENMLGLRSTSASQTAASAAYPSRREASVTLVTWAVEPRIAVDVWVSPSITLAAFAGVNALGLGDRSIGLALGVHSRTYDGTRR